MCGLETGDVKRIMEELQVANKRIARAFEYVENSYCICSYLAPDHTCDVCVIRQALEG